jgi:hypothetical protein
LFRRTAGGVEPAHPVMLRHLLLPLAVCATLPALAQTTEEEYNYCTEGYAMQIKGGLDMKKGYRLVDLLTDTVKERKSEFKALIRDGEAAPCAILLIYTRLATGEKSYLCLPHPASDEKIWDKTYKAFFKGFHSDAITSMTLGIMKVAHLYAGRAARTQ